MNTVLNALSTVLTALVLLVAAPLAIFQVLWAIANLMSSRAVEIMKGRRNQAAIKEFLKTSEGHGGFPQHGVND